MNSADWLVWIIMLALAYCKLGKEWLFFGLVSFALSHRAIWLREKSRRAEIEREGPANGPS